MPREALVPPHVLSEYSRECKAELSRWFFSEEWQPLRRALRDQPGIPLRIRHAGELRALERWPWEALPLDRPILRLPPRPSGVSVATPRQRQPRVLVVVGDEAHLDPSREIQPLRAMARHGQIALLELRGEESGADQLQRQLNPPQGKGWDVLIFLGHSTADPQCGGALQLGNGDWLTGAWLQPSLRQAVDRGLQLVLLNSCGGMDLAHRCVGAGVAWVQCFREPIPADAATAVFTCLLRELRQGQALTLALRKASQQLEERQAVDADMLLSLYCHPEADSYLLPAETAKVGRRAPWLVIPFVLLNLLLVSPELRWKNEGRSNSPENASAESGRLARTPSPNRRDDFLLAVYEKLARELEKRLEIESNWFALKLSLLGLFLLAGFLVVSINPTNSSPRSRLGAQSGESLLRIARSSYMIAWLSLVSVGYISMDIYLRANRMMGQTHGLWIANVIEPAFCHEASVRNPTDVCGWEEFLRRKSGGFFADPLTQFATATVIYLPTIMVYLAMLYGLIVASDAERITPQSGQYRSKRNVWLFCFWIVHLSLLAFAITSPAAPAATSLFYLTFGPINSYSLPLIYVSIWTPLTVVSYVIVFGANPAHPIPANPSKLPIAAAIPGGHPRRSAPDARHQDRPNE
jgi:hypothetical protein